MEDDYKTTVRMSKSASEIAGQIADGGRFDDKLAFFRFAFSYAVKNYFDELNPQKLDAEYDASGVTYNVGSVDQDGFLVKLVQMLYPDCETPYRYIRGIMIFGAEKLGELFNKGKLFPLSNNM